MIRRFLRVKVALLATLGLMIAVPTWRTRGLAAGPGTGGR